MKYNLSQMMCLDIYLSSLSNIDYNLISQQLKTNKKTQLPLIGWDIYSENFNAHIQSAQRKQDILKVVHLAKKYSWNNDIQSIFKNNEFEALLLTNQNQQIVWVNDGFTAMTGYFKNEVLHKTPRILQGAETSITTRKRIREKLSAKKQFREIITNYKKEGVAYKCEVKIFPLHSKETTHYLALERQVV